MKQSTINIIQDLIIRHPRLIVCKESIYKSIELLVSSFRTGNKLLVCGNGGSATDSQHIVGELMKSFNINRKLNINDKEIIKKHFPKSADYLIDNLSEALPVISLVNETALTTAISNDKNNDLVFAQQVLGYGNKNDVLLCISTSGNSQNILYAAQIARIFGLSVIGLTGNNGGSLVGLCNICINAPADKVYLIQEHHLSIYHVICLAIENEFYGEEECF